MKPTFARRTTASFSKARVTSDPLRKSSAEYSPLSKGRTEAIPRIADLYKQLRSVVPTASAKEEFEISDLDIMQHAIDYIYYLNSILED